MSQTAAPRAAAASPLLKPVLGRIMDVDSHEVISTGQWVDEFGAIAAPMAKALLTTSLLVNTPVTADDAAINFENVWQIKGPRAPGSGNMKRRLEVLDFTGVHRQLVFPGTLGLVAAYMYCRADDPVAFQGSSLDSIGGDRKAYSRAVLDAYNEWCIRSGKTSDRLRQVCILVADTPEALLVEAKRLVNKGVRAVMINSGELFGGKSPADPALDPVWSYLADSNTAVLLHIGGEGNFLRTYDWKKAPAFEGFKTGDEFSLDPWWLSVFHLAAQNFMATMVLGWVFERHPKLRFGCIEVGAQWVGPLSENLDLWHANSRKFNQGGDGKVLPLKPSEYIRRNIRVSSFDIEPVDKYIRDFGLRETYCYASDYPHFEGGKAPMVDMGSRIATLGPDMVENFFVHNGAWLLPD